MRCIRVLLLCLGRGGIEGDEVAVGLDGEPRGLCIRLLYGVSINSLWLACSNEIVLGMARAWRCSRNRWGGD